MKNLLERLIDDFHERSLPALSKRDCELPRLPRKADVVIGMRRTGKTFFCYQKIKELLDQGVALHEILYLNFEDDRLIDFSVEHFQLILDIYYARYPENRDRRCHFFLDEIQNIGQWERFVRRLLDTENIQITLTGSSSKLLSKEIATGLRGRALPTEIFPFSFVEYLRYHNIFDAPPMTFGSKTVSRLRKACTSYLEQGGFPEVQHLSSTMRTQVLQGYMHSVLLRDIVERHGVTNVMALKHLLHSINSTPGGQFSVNKFYNTLKSMGIKCTKNSLYEYLDHLEDAYLLYRVPLYSHSESARRVNPAKVYVIDTGLINAASFRKSENSGPLLENLVYMHLRRRGLSIEYIQNRKGHEVDFVATDSITGNRLLIQVSWDLSDEKVLHRELRGLHAAMANLKIDKATIVTWDDEQTYDDNIEVVPAWKWLLT
ncbi:MAG: ATP-binding protein [Planctomycetota bacterium]|jgi:predicted AAA+ superfamily ATPase